ncbi:type II secretion system protein GspD [Mucilaginibacter phyllosphaerae]|uniref:Type IV pilus assembly protein PilQ n=1 Tax=Mucilaginibacter phyllosphaerae TaxID=1812349 RepID=A0ABR6ID94_9SPHI|nr:general secretion pathway protein GspD [Mucilaginibacter phyllosphaerae]MBB3971036.1 type IV pilus assembly protein PilQ [Mucilaginibacter phyllosphaerae]
MYKTFTRSVLIAFLYLVPFCSKAQQVDRIGVIQQNLQNLSAKVPGLNQKVRLMVTGVSIKDYLNALSQSSNLSISSDPGLNFPVFDTFNDVSASNILLLLAKKYNLDLTIVGNIIYVTPYQDPNQLLKPAVKELKIQYSRLDNTLSLDLANDSLVAVSRKITQLSGINVVVPVQMQGKMVSGFIAAAQFDKALGSLAFTNGIKVTKTDDGFYLFQTLEENEEVYVNGDKRTSVRKNFRPQAPGNSGGASGIFSRMVGGQKLLSADAVNAPIADLVKYASQETNKSYSIYSDLKGTITLHVNDITYETFLTLLFKSTDYTFHAEEGIYIIGDRKLEGLRAFKPIHVQNRSIDTIINMIPAEWKRGIEIKEFREQNTLLLSGSGAQIKEVEDFIKRLDVLVPVVTIEVMMIDIHNSRTVSTGISAGISDSVRTGGTVLPGINYTFGAKSINSFLNSISRSTSVNLGHVTPNFYLSLQALEANENVNIRSVPKLSAMNGHPATFSIGKKAYYRNRTQNVIPSLGNPSSIFTDNYQEVKADLSIKVDAVVSGDDEVTLKIKVSMADFTSIPSDGSPPPQAISEFETSLRVHNEDMIMLGGIERTENSESGSGIPFLSRIPVLKWIFSSRSRTNAKVVTVLFIKPIVKR